MIHTITLNPSLDKTAKVDCIEKGGLNRIEITSEDVGGKGLNVSKTIRALHGASKAYVILGGSNGNRIKQKLREYKISTFITVVEENTRTNLKIIDHMNQLTEMNELGPRATNKNIQEIINALKMNVKPRDVVIFGGSVPPGIESKVYKKLINETKKIGAVVILDTNGLALSEGIKACPTMIKPNRQELAELCGVTSLTISQCIEKAKELVKQGIVLVVVTLGEKGALFVTEEDTIHALPIRVKAKSVVGAGDAMIGALAYGYDQKYTFEEIVKLSMATATAVVTTSGTEPADAKVVKRLMKGVVLKRKQ